MLCTLDEQLEVLATHGDIVMLDTTFDRAGRATEDGLFVGKFRLTTLLVLVDGTGVAVASCIHLAMTKDLYAEMLADLLRLSKGRFKPQVILCDYSDAIRSAAHSVFPHIKAVGDKFHLAQVGSRPLYVCADSRDVLDELNAVLVLQAIVRWANKNNLSDRGPEMSADVMLMAECASEAELKPALVRFEAKWSKECLAFYKYFCEVWLSRYTTMLWAKCYRAPEAPNGDSALEGHVIPSVCERRDRAEREWHWNDSYHNHLRILMRTATSDGQSRIDRAMYLLYRDAQVQLLTINTPHLAQAKKRAREQRLKYFHDSRLANKGGARRAIRFSCSFHSLRQ
jgi:hypothetical protein